ncbi:unnamed protein product [Linum trigynum]|uniref:Uncharacterized protein n=1 Tax=Linum trigynum TaxID=586398 RepID=A0AAV2GND1_9ROSI
MAKRRRKFSIIAQYCFLNSPNAIFVNQIPTNGTSPPYTSSEPPYLRNQLPIESFTISTPPTGINSQPGLSILSPHHQNQLPLDMSQVHVSPLLRYDEYNNNVDEAVDGENRDSWRQL